MVFFISLLTSNTFVKITDYQFFMANDIFKQNLDFPGNTRAFFVETTFL
jgi:hypothetical protein